MHAPKRVERLSRHPGPLRLRFYKAKPRPIDREVDGFIRPVQGIAIGFAFSAAFWATTIWFLWR